MKGIRFTLGLLLVASTIAVSIEVPENHEQKEGKYWMKTICQEEKAGTRINPPFDKGAFNFYYQVRQIEEVANIKGSTTVIFPDQISLKKITPGSPIARCYVQLDPETWDYLMKRIRESIEKNEVFASLSEKLQNSGANAAFRQGETAEQNTIAKEALNGFFVHDAFINEMNIKAWKGLGKNATLRDIYDALQKRNQELKQLYEKYTAGRK